MKNIPSIPPPFANVVTFVDASESPSDNTISYIVQIRGELSAQKRGALLLDLEDALRTFESRIRVWHVPLGDKNALRKLRGINLS